VSGTACAACAGRWPAVEDYIADCGPAKAYLHADQFFPGWTVLVLARHVTELFDLPSDERAALMEQVARVARAVAAAVSARKMNYALLGNQLPHIHWHLIPRAADDPAPHESPWSVPHAPRPPSAGERTDRIAAIRGRLRA
jgi:diadenosine tetraphosphate (Ap4A) HIT family hydrolase